MKATFRKWLPIALCCVPGIAVAVIVGVGLAAGGAALGASFGGPLGLVLIGLAVGWYLTVRYSALEKMHLDQPPEVLTQKAREIVARLGYPEKPADSAAGFDDNTDFSDYVENDKNNKPHWDEVLAGRPTLLQFWYRQSPKFMIASGYHDLLFTPGVIAEYDPATVVTGMINVELDPKGRLIGFQAVPPQRMSLRPRPGSRTGVYCLPPPTLTRQRCRWPPRNGIHWDRPTHVRRGSEPGRARIGRCALKPRHGTENRFISL